MQERTIASVLKEVFIKSGKSMTLNELYFIVINTGFEDSKKTKDSIRGIIQNMKIAKKIKRIKLSTYIQNLD